MGNIKKNKQFVKMGFYVKHEHRDYILERAEAEDRATSAVLREIMDEEIKRKAVE